MDGLAVLTRLEREALEREARALRRLDQSLLEAGQRIGELDAEVARERRAAATLDGGDALLVTYLAAYRERGRAATRRLAELEQAHEAQLGRVLTRRLELERLEILAGRRRARERVASARREQKLIDDLAAMRARARP